MNKDFSNNHTKEKKKLQLHRYINGLFGTISQVIKQETTNNNQKTKKMSQKTTKVRDLSMYSTEEFTLIERMQDSMVALSASYANLDATKNAISLQETLMDTMKHLAEGIKEVLVKSETVNAIQQDLPLKDTTKTETPKVENKDKEGKTLEHPNTTKAKEEAKSKNDKPATEATKETKKPVDNAPSEPILTGKKDQPIDTEITTPEVLDTAKKESTDETDDEYVKALADAEIEIAQLVQSKLEETGKIEGKDRKSFVDKYQELLPESHIAKTHQGDAFKAVGKIIAELEANKISDAKVDEKIDEKAEETPKVEAKADEPVVNNQKPVEEEKKEISDTDIDAAINEVENDTTVDKTDTKAPIDFDAEEYNETAKSNVTVIDWDKIESNLISAMETKDASTTNPKMLTVVTDTVKSNINMPFDSDAKKEQYKDKFLSIIKGIKGTMEVEGKTQQEQQDERNSIWGSNKTIDKILKDAISEQVKALAA